MPHIFKPKKIVNLLGIKTIAVVVLLILNVASLAANSNYSSMKFLSDQIPVKGLNSEELDQLRNNKMVVRSLNSYKDIRLKSGSDETGAILKQFREIHPNFLAEALFVMPVKSGKEQATLMEVKQFLQSVKQFEDIPYYSKQNGTWNPMFEDINILEKLDSPDGSEKITTVQKMRPFNPYTAVYLYTLSDGILEYDTFNTTPLYYKWMKGVKEEKMHTTLLVQAHPGYLFFYGLGGARAFDFFGLFGKRLDVAFIGRIKAFFEWFHKEFVLGIVTESLDNNP